jgi:peptide deformylase
MVGIKENSFGESLQKWLPLITVPLDKIPKPEQIEKFDPEKIEFYLKISVALQIFCMSKNGIGLAAVQCGIPYGLIVVSEDSAKYRTFIDCNYEGIGEQIDSMEGCLSIKDDYGNLKRFFLKRYKKIRVTGIEINLNNIKKKYDEIDEIFEGLFGIVMQHEIDHNKGILVSEIGREVEVIN